MQKVSPGSCGIRSAVFRPALAVLALLPACLPATTSSAPPSEPWIAGNRAAAGPPGSRILVERNRRWLPATILRHDDASGRVLVHYQGFGPEWDELVTADRVRPDPDPDTPRAQDYRQGEPVLVEVGGGRLVLAVVDAQVSPHAWRVQYQGYGPGFAEVVAAHWIRRTHAGRSARQPGQRVLVDVGGGSTAAGTVIAVVAEHRWLVRFDGTGPDQDREVGPDEIRGAGETPPTNPPSPPPASQAGPPLGPALP